MPKQRPYDPHAIQPDHAAHGPGQRLDKWLWFVRLFRSRAEAADMCASRHLRLDGRVIDKSHATVRPGSIVSFPKGGRVIVVKVLALAEQRGPFVVAQELYEDLSPQPAAQFVRTGTEHHAACPA